MNDLMTARELKEQASLIDLLTRLGFKPLRKSGKEQIYLSMLRDSDTKPSFAVNDELGVWFDHGTGKGGNIIDFGLAFWKHLSFNEVVEKLQDVTDVQTGSKSLRPRKAVKIPHYKVEQVKELGTHPAITEYLKSRGVFDVAVGSVKEIYYYVEDQKGHKKHFFASGWKNENESWEVRNKYFKGCIGHKGMTFIEGEQKRIVVFEGYINYLSWRLENAGNTSSILVINTLSLLGLAIERAKAYSFIDLYLDRDKHGHSASKEFVNALPYAVDRSGVYDGHNDYNDKLVHSINKFSLPGTVSIKVRSF